MESADVVVVGAGIAGLAAARTLHQRFATVVVEARTRMGGRLFGTIHPETGDPVELGGAYVAVERQPVMRELIAQTATAMRPRPSTAPPAFVIEGQAVPLAALPVDAMLDLERLLFRLLTAAERFDLDLPLARQEIAELDVPFREFLEAETGPTVASRLVESYFTQLAGAPADVVSATWPVGLIAWRGKSILAMLTSKVMQFEKGTAEFVRKLGEDLDVRLGCAVTAVQDLGDRVRVDLSDGRSLLARAVIVAVPVNALGAMAISPELPEALREYLSQGHPGTGQKLWIRARGLDSPVTVTTSDSRLLHVTTDRIVDGVNHLVGFGLAGALDATQTGVVGEALAAVLPDAELLDVTFHDWTADPWSQGTWMVHRPGEYALLGELTHARGRIAFAGSDVADQWAGNMEGAAQSGRRAAAAVIDILDEQR